MSEMLANQYFISGRYFEAFEEYSRLPKEKRDNLMIRKKMIISATLNENFNTALSLLAELSTYNPKLSEEIMIDAEECTTGELADKLKKSKPQSGEGDNSRIMKIAIMLFFSYRKSSLEYFHKLKNTCYADVVNTFLKSLL